MICSPDESRYSSANKHKNLFTSHSTLGRTIDSNGLPNLINRTGLDSSSSYCSEESSFPRAMATSMTRTRIWVKITQFNKQSTNCITSPSLQRKRRLLYPLVLIVRQQNFRTTAATQQTPPRTTFARKHLLRGERLRADCPSWRQHFLAFVHPWGF